MHRIVPWVLLLLAFLTFALTWFGEGGYGKLSAMRESLRLQSDKNFTAQRQLKELRREILGLRSEDRALEKAARNELGMARPSEKIFIFDDRPADDRGTLADRIANRGSE